MGERFESAITERVCSKKTNRGPLRDMGSALPGRSLTSQATPELEVSGKSPIDSARESPAHDGPARRPSWTSSAITRRYPIECTQHQQTLRLPRDPAGS